MFLMDIQEEIKKIAPAIQLNKEKIKILFVEKLQNNEPDFLHMFQDDVNKIEGFTMSLIDMVFGAVMQESLKQFIPSIKPMVHQYQSLGLLPDHYKNLGKYLIISIREALEESVTHEEIIAFQLIFYRLAEIATRLEKSDYKKVKIGMQTWFFKSFRVVKKVQESDLVVLIYIVPIDGKIAPIDGTDNYVSVRLTMLNEAPSLQQSFPVIEKTGHKGYVMTINRSANIQKNDRLTDYLFNRLTEGDTLEITSPKSNKKYNR